MAVPIDLIRARCGLVGVRRITSLPPVVVLVRLVSCQPFCNFNGALGVTYKYLGIPSFGGGHFWQFNEQLIRIYFLFSLRDTLTSPACSHLSTCGKPSVSPRLASSEGGRLGVTPQSLTYDTCKIGKNISWVSLVMPLNPHKF